MKIATRRLTHCLAASAIAVPLIAAPLSAAMVGAGAASAASPRTPLPALVGQLGESGLVPPGEGEWGGDRWGGGSMPGQSATDLSAADIDAVDATDAQSAGVVQISTMIDFGAGQAAGSGIVIGSGLVITNHHVVQGATEVEVIDPVSEASYQASVLGYSDSADVAVLKVENPDGLRSATFSADGVQVGDSVTAIGDAGGDGGSLSAASGEVLGTGEQITVDNEDGTTSNLRELIAVDADIIPGDSGGALLNADGDVVGMNVAAGFQQARGGAEITGYVIDILDVRDVLLDVFSNNTAAGVVLGTPGFLGVSMSPATMPVSAGSGVPIDGVLDGGPAAEAGIGAGDVITAIGSTEVSDPESLSAAITQYRPGSTVQVTWSDGVQTQQAEVTLVPGPVA